MYACPNCGAKTFSFWAKVCASDLAPRTCPNCGKAFVAKVWPMLLFSAILLLLAIASTFATLLWKTSWPGLVAILLLAIGFALTVHVAQLTPSTPRRTHVAKLLRWAGLAILVAVVASKVLEHG